jgi:hypothetical protein
MRRASSCVCAKGHKKVWALLSCQFLAIPGALLLAGEALHIAVSDVQLALAAAALPAMGVS